MTVELDSYNRIPGTLHYMDENIRMHPVYPTLVARYRTARKLWASNEKLREIAALFDVSEFQSCSMDVLNAGVFIWTETSPLHQTLTIDHYKQAFMDAGAML